MADPPVLFRPRRLRAAAWAAATACVIGAGVVSAALSGQVAGGPARFGTTDRAATVGLGVIAALALLALARPLVAADADGVRVRNVIGGRELPWRAVNRVRFDRGDWWATLELPDGELVAVLAVQAVDRAHAVAAVRALRALHAGHQPRYRERHDPASDPPA